MARVLDEDELIEHWTLVGDELRSLIRRHNHISCQAAGMQLRAAAHIGVRPR